eukprot:2117003-Pleurochrysis_carterae.AAC.1
MHLRAPPDADMLITSKFVGQAFYGLGTYGTVKKAEQNAASGAGMAWAIAAGAGDKGRKMDMILVSKWSEERGAPVAEALARPPICSATRAARIWSRRCGARPSSATPSPSPAACRR